MKKSRKRGRRGTSGLIRGFLGVDGTLNSMYRQCEVHVAVGVEGYIHVPQVTQGSCIQQQQFSVSMAVEHHCKFVWQLSVET